MSRREHAAERHRLELVARIELQRLKLRLQARVRASRQPWKVSGAAKGWHRNVLIASVLVACTAVVYARRRALASAIQGIS